MSSNFFSLLDTPKILNWAFWMSRSSFSSEEAMLVVVRNGSLRKIKMGASV
jgi:hypothetical protein